MPLSAATLKMINVRVGGAGPTAGTLADPGHLSWPLVLRGPAQQALDGLIAEALRQARAAALDPGTYADVTGRVGALRDDLRSRLLAGQISTDSYRAGEDFLEGLASSLTVLERPDAAKFFDGTYAARGGDVRQLVENMTAGGLQFAPASPGSEAAYFALHGALVSYVRAAESAGFRSAVAPPGP